MLLPSDTLPPVAILAGGLATRMRPHTDSIPKSLLPVAGRPFLAHQLDLLRSQGVRRVVLCVGHLGDQIESAFGKGREYGIDLSYSHDGPGLLGTAGALRNALPLLGSDFFTLYGDSYLHVDYAVVWKAYLRQSRPALMTVVSSARATEPANAWLESGEIRAYGKSESRPEMHHVDFGLSVFNHTIFRDGVRELSQLQSELARDGRLAGLEVADRYFEIGSPRGLADLESHLQARA